MNWPLKRVEHYTFGRAVHINLVSEGFKSYFADYPLASYSFFPNGIDELFLNTSFVSPPSRVKTILYAGNIGDGQGLHLLIPECARLLNQAYRFVIIGDGGARGLLEETIRRAEVTNVELRNPVHRNDLIDAYRQADYLLIHLNDLNAFRRVLPSKLFEYGATNKPILAGVAGYPARFVAKYLPNSILFPPGNAQELAHRLHSTPYATQNRTDFQERFRRKVISQQLAGLLLQVIKTQPTNTAPTVTRDQPV